MASLARVLFGPVTRDEAVSFARNECERRDWPWQEPVRVSRSFVGWRVMTNAQMRGGNVNITISRSGTVQRAAFARR